MGIHTGEMALSWQNKDILWSKEIEGEGQSSIIQAGAKIFITSAIENNLRLLHCFDKEKGDLLWKREIRNNRAESIHRMNGWATATPATEGDRVVAFFGPAGLHCFDLEGNKKWDIDLGVFPSHWGVRHRRLFIMDWSFKIAMPLENHDWSRLIFKVEKLFGTPQGWTSQRGAGPHQL